MADCLFCRIAAGEVPATIVRDEPHLVAFRDVAPQAPTHILLIPRRHVADAAELAAVEPGLLGELVRAAAEVAAAEGIGGSGYRLVANTGPESGQTVFHVHLHLLGGAQLGHFGVPGAGGAG